jgi:hypothetical protein
MIVATNLRTRIVNAAAARTDAMLAELAGGFLELLDFKDLTAKIARPAGFSGNFRHRRPAQDR